MSLFLKKEALCVCKNKRNSNSNSKVSFIFYMQLSIHLLIKFCVVNNINRIWILFRQFFKSKMMQKDAVFQHLRY